MKNTLIITVLEFLEKANITIDGCQEKFSDYSQSTTLKLEIESIPYQREIYYEEQTVSFLLDPKKNMVRIRKEAKCHSKQPEFDDKRNLNFFHLFESKQKVVEFTVCQDKLTITTATIFQSTLENVLGDRKCPIAEFQTIDEFNNREKLSIANNSPIITKEFYKVPNGYNVKQGVKNIGEKISSNQVVKRKK